VPETVRPKGAVVKVHVRLPLVDAELGWLSKYPHYTNDADSRRPIASIAPIQNRIPVLDNAGDARGSGWYCPPTGGPNAPLKQR
jgi:hypothetical protein